MLLCCIHYRTWCVSFYREHGVPVKIARIGHTYGPTMDIYNDPRVFASFMRDVIEGRDITMLSDGSAQRPFCYIADAVAAFFLLLFKGRDGEASRFLPAFLLHNQTI